MNKKEIKVGDYCYIKVGSASPQAHLNNMVVKVLKQTILTDAAEKAKGPAWDVEPQLFTATDNTRVYTSWYKWALNPIPGPTVEDVVDTLEVLAFGNKATFGALQEFAVKAKEAKKNDKPSENNPNQ